jgi:hypothetical protein
LGSTINSQFNTYYGNTSGNAGGAFVGLSSSHVTIFNDIYYGNTAPVASQLGFETSFVTINYALVSSGNTDVIGYAFEGQPGNITGNPLFVDSANGDFHLQLGSPAIGAATSSTSRRHPAEPIRATRASTSCATA